jgi:putative DNA primase/helicase
MITKLAPVRFDPLAACPRWETFLEQVQPDQEVRGLLRRLVGLSLTGLVKEHVLPINIGTGRNGKGVFMNTLLRILGDAEYARAVPADMLMSRRSEAHPTDKTLLYRVRFASATETEEGRVLNVALVKLLTGGDPITARRMREDFWTFHPTHKLWLSTNHRPVITETKDAIWKRVLLIPWEVTIPDAEQDYGLEEHLVRQEGAGILRWAVEACREYQRVGLAAPERVRAASAEYRAEQDEIGMFVTDRCVLSESAKCTRSVMFGAYRTWCEEHGHDVMSPAALAERLREKGVSDAHGVHGGKGYGERGWKGIRLKLRGESVKTDGENFDRSETPYYS